MLEIVLFMPVTVDSVEAASAAAELLRADQELPELELAALFQRFELVFEAEFPDMELTKACMDAKDCVVESDEPAALALAEDANLYIM